MEQATDKQALRSRIIKTEPIHWRELDFIQQDDFKELPEEAMEKLKNSLLSNMFTTPFYVWQDESSGKLYCLDGKHRTLALNAVEQDGHTIPDELPAVFIQADDIQDAAKLVLIFSSIYAKITTQGLHDFLELYELKYDQMKMEVDLPEFSTPRFEQKFDIFGTKNIVDEDVLVQEDAVAIVQPGDIYEIDGHRIACGSFRDEAIVAALMEGKKARIINCDPPYNIPMETFADERHKAFAEGVGEMNDEVFVDFLRLIMQRSIENSVLGAIHYVFMDFRHVWHITEAGRRAYGPKGFKQMCVWTKDNFANGAFYRSQHELCFVFNSPAAQAQWNADLLDEGGGYKNDNKLVFIFKNPDGAKHLSHLELKNRIRTNVWSYPSATSAANPDRKEIYNHPTPKPVAMVADSILDTTNEGEIVVDWFLGSGTCLVGCAQTKRICYATEIGPHHVQGSILRYLKWAERNGEAVNFRHVNGTLTLSDFQAAMPVAS